MAAGLPTCGAFAEHLLELEHRAVRPGESPPLSAEDHPARCGSVDRDGAAALARWRAHPPESGGARRALADEEMAPMVTEGVAAMERYLRKLGRGVRPRHPVPRGGGGARMSAAAHDHHGGLPGGGGGRPGGRT